MIGKVGGGDNRGGVGRRVGNEQTAAAAAALETGSYSLELSFD